MKVHLYFKMVFMVGFWLFFLWYRVDGIWSKWSFKMGQWLKVGNKCVTSGTTFYNVCNVESYLGLQLGILLIVDERDHHFLDESTLRLLHAMHKYNEIRHNFQVASSHDLFWSKQKSKNQRLSVHSETQKSRKSSYLKSWMQIMVCISAWKWFKWLIVIFCRSP